MVDFSSREVSERELPTDVDYYEITEDGTVIDGIYSPGAVYISEFDVGYFADKETMLHVRECYGKYIGVMRDLKYDVTPREYRTTKILISVVRGVSQDE